MQGNDYKICFICGEEYDIFEPHICTPDSTKKRLAIDLAKSEAPRWMIAKARDGFYDDFDSPIAFPIMQLARDASDNGLPEIARRAKNGDYDSTKEESDAWFEREGKYLK